MVYTNDEFEASKFLGNAVGRKNPFMRKIACMDTEWREISALLEVAKLFGKDEMTKQDQEDLKKLDKTVTWIGQALFKMDIVSHLSMKADADEEVADAR